MKGLTIVLIIIYALGSVMAAKLPECWVESVTFIKAHEVPIAMVVVPPASLILWTAHIVSGCPEQKYEDTR